ncbi:MAG: FHA domain-containing protein, partial [Planctomycetota bacterium]
AEQVGSSVETRAKRLRAGVPAYLFAITHENLGEDIEAWLSWWDQARVTYPPQLVPAVPSRQALLHVVKGEPAPRTMKLEGSSSFNVGRDEKSKVPLNHTSVSRLHATILRLHNRLVIRDEGSRFGTVLNGAQVRIAFLSPGDRVGLGKVELTFDLEAAPHVGEDELLSVDPEAFFALEEMQHSSVATGLVEILDANAKTAWMEASAARVHEDPKRQADLVPKVKRVYAERARKALVTLPKILGGAPTNPLDVGAWRDKLAAKRAELGPQVLPAGWIPERDAPQPSGSKTSPVLQIPPT